MIRTICALAALAGFAIWTVAAGQPPTGTPREETAKVEKAATEQLATGCNAFALDLYRAQSAQASKDDNFAIAPYSVAESLGLIGLGARGKTADEIAKALHCTLKPEQLGPTFASLGVGSGGYLVAGETTAPKPRFGARIREADGGLAIAEVVKESPAWEAGLRPGDRILRLGDRSVRNAVEYANALDGFIDQIDGEVADAGGVRRFTAKLNPPSAGSRRIRPLVASALWGNKTVEFLPAFKSAAAGYFNAAVENVDFGDVNAARTRINRWTADATDDRVPALVPPNALAPETTLALTNALHFEAAWLVPFNPKYTDADGAFTANGKKLKATFMRRKWNFNYAKNDDCRALELPIEGDFSMILLLPEKDAIGELEKKVLTPDALKKLLDAMQRKATLVSLPRFSASAEGDLQKSLAELGVTAAFGRDADFTGMTRQGKTALSRLVHRAAVAVDERGVKASAGTGAVAEPLDRNEVEFTADHPFVFLIRDMRSRVILFVGRVTNPQ